MIIYHQDNIAAFAGYHTVYWFGQLFSVTAGIAAGGAVVAGVTDEFIVRARRRGRR